VCALSNRGVQTYWLRLFGSQAAVQIDQIHLTEIDSRELPSPKIAWPLMPIKSSGRTLRI
jgi:hypothetical protein